MPVFVVRPRGVQWVGTSHYQENAPRQAGRHARTYVSAIYRRIHQLTARRTFTKPPPLHKTPLLHRQHTQSTRTCDSADDFHAVALAHSPVRNRGAALIPSEHSWVARDAFRFSGQAGGTSTLSMAKSTNVGSRSTASHSAAVCWPNVCAWRGSRRSSGILTDCSKLLTLDH